MRKRKKLEQSSLNNLLNFLREFENKVSPKKELTESEMSSLKELLYKKHKNAVSESISWKGNIFHLKVVENVAAITDSIKYSLIERNNAILDRRKIDTELSFYRDDKTISDNSKVQVGASVELPETNLASYFGIKHEDRLKISLE